MNLFRAFFGNSHQPAVDDGRIDAIANAGLADSEFVKSPIEDNLDAVLTTGGNQPSPTPVRPRMVYTNGIAL